MPDSPEKLAALMSTKVTVPHKIRKRLTAVAQFIENFKHRKTVVDLMRQAFAASVTPTSLQKSLAAHPNIPMIVDVWYDDAMRNALNARTDWGQVQGLSQAEHFGIWFQYYDTAGKAVVEEAADDWKTVLYQPIGAFAPAQNCLVSDSDYVEVLDRDRRPDADPAAGANAAARTPFPVSRLPFQRPVAAHLCAPDHQALIGPALGSSGRRPHAQRATLHGGIRHPANRYAAGRISKLHSCRKRPSLALVFEQGDTMNTKTIIHARFAPDGSVVDIGERPDWADPQQWFNVLSYATVNSYQALTNGRGVFRIAPEELAALETRH